MEPDLLMTIQQASEWASQHLQKSVTSSNISYLIQYGKIENRGKPGLPLISQVELKAYYDCYYLQRERAWKEKLGQDLHWKLAFESLKESETTKHVHRLHPYKGKFIPQLAEYFLDRHTDDLKREVYFQTGDVILDPFCGSGTTLVQANELGLHAVGMDISLFNSLISNVKINEVDLEKTSEIIADLDGQLEKFWLSSQILEFERGLDRELAAFNARYFPSPEFKRRLTLGELDEDQYCPPILAEFLNHYRALVRDYGVRLKQEKSQSFLDRWYLQNVRDELEIVAKYLELIGNLDIQSLLRVILSRTVRSCRATTHADLATLKEPILAPYYCHKHGKICVPTFSIRERWKSYTKDSLRRLQIFQKLRSSTLQYCAVGDSRSVDILAVLLNEKPALGRLVKQKKIQGIFSSPPYVGVIDYHEQHAYAYDLFGFSRKDEAEIGRMEQGQGKNARAQYVQSIADVLKNCQRFLAPEASIFLVANDKYQLYPLIAQAADMKIVQEFKRPVLNRTERDKGAYGETIFLLKKSKYHSVGV